MTWEIKYSSEDNDQVEIITSAFKLHTTLWEVYSMIRSRLKYNDLTEDEVKFLQEIQSYITEFDV